jgi:hypothetical protein
MHLPFPPHPHLRQPHSSRRWVWIHQAELDRQLADGVDPASSPALQLRACQLQGTHCRHALAAEIDSVMARAAHPPHWHSATIPVRASEVLAASQELLAVRTGLLGSGARGIRGIALTACLVHEPASPVYHPGPRTVAELAQLASTALACSDIPAAIGAIPAPHATRSTPVSLPPEVPPGSRWPPV